MTGTAAVAARKVRRFMNLNFVVGSIGRATFVTVNRALKAETESTARVSFSSRQFQSGR
jgi:hypothetical protein